MSYKYIGYGMVEIVLDIEGPHLKYGIWIGEKNGK